MLLYMFVIFIEKTIRQYSKVNGRTPEMMLIDDFLKEWKTFS